MTRMEAERRRRGWTQIDVAYHARIGQGDVSRIERRMLIPTPRIAGRIAHVLGVPVDELFVDVAVAEAGVLAGNVATAQ